MMRTRLTTACLATLLAGGIASAQTLPGQPVRRAANAVNQATDVAQGTIRNTIDGVRNTAQAVDARVGVFDNSRSQVQAQPYWDGRTRGWVQPQMQYSGSSAMSLGHVQPGLQQTYRLQYDSSGREFICVGGQRVYFDQPSSQHQFSRQDQSGDQRYRAAYGSYDQQGSTQGTSDQPVNGQGQAVNRGDDFENGNRTAADLNADSTGNVNASAQDSRVQSDAEIRANVNGSGFDTDATPNRIEVDASGNLNGSSNLNDNRNGGQALDLNGNAEAGITSGAGDRAGIGGAAEINGNATTDQPSGASSGEIDASGSLDLTK